MEILFFMIIIILFGWWGSSVMDNKGRSQVGGFFLGVFLGILGILITYMISPSAEHQAKEYKKIKDLIDKD